MSLPTFTQTHFDNNTKVFLELKGAPAPDGVAFDSVLKPSRSPAHNHTLEIHLKLFLNKFDPPNHLKAFTVLDWDTKLWVVVPWSHGGWVHFVQSFLRQANMWNEKFWLTPPAGFDKLDIKSGNHTIRPNVFCVLNVELVGSSAQAHKTIRVVNLDRKFAVEHGGLDAFRSDAGNYTNFDARDGLVGQKTVAHEIGHAIGQKHIGVTVQDKACKAAMLMDEIPKDNPLRQAIPAEFINGSASDACYGHFSPHLGGNIMGAGNDFDVVNAQPWLDCMTMHTMWGNWTAHKGRVAPQLV